MSALGLGACQLTGEALIAAYREPQRRYHGESHIADCLALLDEVRDLAERPAEVALALWFHDAVYDTKASDNEARSGDWAVQFLEDAGADPTVAERVRGHILATRHAAGPAAGDTALTVDIDLSILGRPPELFDAFDRAIREEYAWVPGFLYRRKRAEVLRGFLDRPAIYLTPALQERFEAPARDNLQRALVRLAS